MQTHRILIDRLQTLSSTLSSQLTDTNERERVRRRLNDLTRRWSELEQDILSEEENLEEIKTLSDSFEQIRSTAKQWIERTKSFIDELTNTKTVDVFEQLIPKGKSFSFEYQTIFENLQRLRNRFNRLAQLNKTSEATQKVLHSFSFDDLFFSRFS